MISAPQTVEGEEKLKVNEVSPQTSIEEQDINTAETSGKRERRRERGHK